MASKINGMYSLGTQRHQVGNGGQRVKKHKLLGQCHVFVLLVQYLRLAVLYFTNGLSGLDLFLKPVFLKHNVDVPWGEVEKVGQRRENNYSQHSSLHEKEILH